MTATPWGLSTKAVYGDKGDGSVGGVWQMKNDGVGLKGACIGLMGLKKRTWNSRVMFVSAELSVDVYILSETIR